MFQKIHFSYCIDKWDNLKPEVRIAKSIHVCENYF